MTGSAAGKRSTAAHTIAAIHFPLGISDEDAQRLPVTCSCTAVVEVRDYWRHAVTRDPNRRGLGPRCPDEWRTYSRMVD